MFDLFSQMNTDIQRLLLEALKVAVRKPRQLSFLKDFLKSSAEAQRNRERHEAAGLHVPPFLIASITSNCNLLCAGCYSRANRECADASPGRPMPAERWEALFSEAGMLGVCFILLAGGEPMLRQDVLEAATRHREILFPVFTNGTLMGRDALELFDGHRNLVPVISLEGGREATDARRGRGVYGRILDAMEALKAKRILFGASITVTKRNVADVTDEEFVKGLKRAGCGLIFYVEYVPSDNVSAELAPGSAERAMLKARAARLKEALRLMIISFPGDEADYGGCLAAGRGFVHINMDGSVEPCPFSPYSDTNLSAVTLAEALKSPFLAGMREDGFLLGEHSGGCLLFDRREEVRALLDQCKNKISQAFPFEPS